ncbi:MAG: hypothetical protein EXQ56_06585 [Acidobacteria bacterium]|nr:hypothetical protein [Acidobacteriota bacterium]
MRKSIFVFLLALITILFVPAGNAAGGCAEVQLKVDSIRTTANYSGPNASSWADVQERLGEPSQIETVQTVTILQYAFSGCSVRFTVNSEGKISSKGVKIGAAAVSSNPTVTQKTTPEANSQNSNDLANAIRSLQSMLKDLQAQISTLEKLTNNLVAANPPPNQVEDPGALQFLQMLRSGVTSDTVATTPSPAVHLTPATIAPPATSQASTAPKPSTTSTQASPAIPATGCAENGSCYGDISPATGRPKTVFVDGYTRKDGTYFRGHVRSAQAEMKALFAANPNLDFTRMRVIHPLMGDNNIPELLKFIASHEQRHQNQLRDILKLATFPTTMAADMPAAT